MVSKTNTRTIEESPFRNLPKDVKDDKSLNYCTKNIFSVLYDTAKVSGYCYTPTKVLVEKTGFKKASVRKALDTLRKQGYIKFEVDFNLRKIYVQTSIFSVEDIDTNTYNRLTDNTIPPWYRIISQDAKKSKSEIDQNTYNQIVKDRFYPETNLLKSGLSDRFGKTPTQRLLYVLRLAHLATTRQEVPKKQLGTYFKFLRSLQNHFAEYQIAVMVLMQYGRIKVGRSSASTKVRMPLMFWVNNPKIGVFNDLCRNKLNTRPDIFDRDLKRILSESIKEAQQIVEFWDMQDNDNLPIIR